MPDPIETMPADPTPPTGCQFVGLTARVPAGMKKFKVHCTNHGQPARFVLAKTEKEAVAYYRHATGLDGRMAYLVKMYDETGEEPTEPIITVEKV